jgi:hypothetical protein
VGSCLSQSEKADGSLLSLRAERRASERPLAITTSGAGDGEIAKRPLGFGIGLGRTGEVAFCAAKIFLIESVAAGFERIENVNDWPTPFARTLCRDVERVALLRVFESYDPWDRISGREGLRVLCLLAAGQRSGRYGCNQKRAQENPDHFVSINARDRNWLALSLGNCAAERVQSFLS